MFGLPFVARSFPMKIARAPPASFHASNAMIGQETSTTA